MIRPIAAVFVAMVVVCGIALAVVVGGVELLAAHYSADQKVIAAGMLLGLFVGAILPGWLVSLARKIAGMIDKDHPR